MEVTDPSNALRISIERAQEFYNENPLPDARFAAPYLEAISASLANLETKKGEAIVFLESLLAGEGSVSIFHLHLLDYCFGKLKWAEGFVLLESLHKQHEGCDLAFKIEQIIRRVYDQNWTKGMCQPGSTPPPSIWELIDESHT